MKKETSSIVKGNKAAKIAGKSKTATKQKPSVPFTGWKKVKIAGRLLSDDGGTGLEGLLGLEVLENFDAPIRRQKIEKPKRHAVKEIDSDADSGDDSRNERKKQKKKKAKGKAEKKAGQLEAKPGRFVLLRPTEDGANGEQSVAKNQQKSIKKSKKNSKTVVESANGDALDLDELSAWNGLGVPEPILKVLAEKGFKEPTEIQRLTLPAAILGRRDILGAAETGSGKTLAFGIPMIHGIMQMKNAPRNQPFRKLSKKQPKDESESIASSDPVAAGKRNKGKKLKLNRDDRDNCTPPPEEVNNFPDFGRDIVEDESDDADEEDDEKPLYALVLTPTRELAVQVKDHLVAAAKYTDIHVAAIFGGLAQVKQERVLSKCPEIVVATPGRLWELITEGNKHLNKLNGINFLVVDETDRMIEKGHFEELKQILERLNADEARKEQRQNFVFSATLTLIHDLPQYLRLKNMNRKRKLQPQTAEQKLQSVIEYFGISQPKIIDITPSQTTGGTAQKLTECRITCSRELKDLYLYYFLQKHRGRTIVFCNSIDCVRRLAKLFAILECSPWPLHAKMAQRQRLKNLERFTDSSTGLLIATDVAARGLDIPNVEHVIHYQVPRTSENYIHRSGRTARGNKEGIAVLLMEPAEVKDYVKLCRSLKRSEDLPLFPVADRYLTAVKDRVNLAREIDVLELKLRRKNTDIGWLKKTAKEMDIMVDDMSDFSEADLYDSDDGGGVIERSLERREVKQKQDALKRLLARPIFPKGISYKYPSTITASASDGGDATTTATSIVDNMLKIGPSGDGTKDKAVTVMKNAIEEYKLAKKNRNKRVRPL